MEFMEKLDENFFCTESGEKVHFSGYIPKKAKKMYDWLRASYPQSPIPEQINQAIVEKIKAINKAAPKPFDEAG